MQKRSLAASWVMPAANTVVDVARARNNARIFLSCVWITSSTVRLNPQSRCELLHISSAKYLRDRQLRCGVLASQQDRPLCQTQNTRSCRPDVRRRLLRTPAKRSGFMLACRDGDRKRASAGRRLARAREGTPRLPGRGGKSFRKHRAGVYHATTATPDLLISITPGIRKLVETAAEQGNESTTASDCGDSAGLHPWK